MGTSDSRVARKDTVERGPDDATTRRRDEVMFVSGVGTSAGRLRKLSCVGHCVKSNPYQQAPLDARRGGGGSASLVQASGTSRSRNQQCRALSLADSEVELLDAISSKGTRNGDNFDEQTNAQMLKCIQELEADGGTPNPTASSDINGRWRLLYTTRPGTSSPVQRPFTGVESFSIFQDVSLEKNGAVNNVVVFGDKGELKVEARAVTDSLPLKGFVPRQGQGLPLLGKSSNEPPKGPNTRVDFQFTRAGFDFGPFKFPYPVPFRLLNDEAKGWLDITYLSSTVRIARGNKGTLFILKKEPGDGGDKEPEINDKLGVLGLIESNPDANLSAEILGLVKERPSEDMLEFLEGEWKLKWTSQGETASGIQKFATGFDNFQVISRSGCACCSPRPLNRLENVAKFLPFLILRAQALISQDEEEESKFNVNITGASLNIGSLRIPAPIKGQGWLEVLYVDEDIRVSKGSKGSLFVHTRSNLL